jgi:hypothetical protein
MDFSGFLRINSRDDDSRVLAIHIGACTAPFVSWLLSHRKGGSVKIFYYHDVSRLIASMSFRSTSRTFPIHLRVFPFSLPSLPSEMNLSTSLGTFILCTQVSF